MCSFPANSTGWASPGVINEAVIEDAPPNSTIYYKWVTFHQVPTVVQ